MNHLLPPIFSSLISTPISLPSLQTCCSLYPSNSKKTNRRAPTPILLNRNRIISSKTVPSRPFLVL
ncbi:hypothetical protein LINPERPRIM_LOCUS5119 [Linum perenne]